jgi:hypothetical protein
MAEVGLMDGVVPDIPPGFSGVAGARGAERPQIIIRKFEKKYRPDPENPQKLLEEHWVEWGKPGVNNWATRQRVKALMPRPEKGKRAALEWDVIGPAYEAWLKGEEAPVDGTPLFAWPGLPREIAEALKATQIFTVEQLAQFQDDRLGRMPFPGMRDWKARAQRFVEAQGDMSATGIADKMKARDDEIDRLKSQAEEKDALLAQLSERLSAVEAQQPAPKRRGRPPKNPKPEPQVPSSVDDMADEVMEGI